MGRAAPDLDPNHFVAQLPLPDAVLMTFSSPLSLLRCGIICLLTAVLSSCARFEGAVALASRRQRAAGRHHHSFPLDRRRE